MTLAYSPLKEISHYDSIFFSNKAPEFWLKEGVSIKDISPYLGPSEEAIIKNKTELHFFSFYHFWDPQENFYYSNFLISLIGKILFSDSSLKIDHFQ